VDEWLPVDQYTGGVEHATLHLMYARFVVKALRDRGYLSFDEPFQALLNQGQVILDGAAMSKSKGNLVVPGEVYDTYGADTLRGTMLFAGPPEDDIDWADVSPAGMHKWLSRVWRITLEHLQDGAGQESGDAADDLRRATHVRIAAISDDYDARKYNVAIAKLMELTNAIVDARRAGVGGAPVTEALESLLLMLAPICPFITEELWGRMGHDGSVHEQSWPTADPALLVVDEVDMVSRSTARSGVGSPWRLMRPRTTWLRQPGRTTTWRSSSRRARFARPSTCPVAWSTSSSGRTVQGGMVGGVGVVTDSTADLPLALADELGLRVVPMTVTFRDRTFISRVTISDEEFYERLAASAELPTTAQPNPAWFEEAYADCADEGLDAAVSIHVSKQLSGTVSSAMRAAEDAPLPVTVMDSRQVGGGLALMALAAQKVAQSGGSADGSCRPPAAFATNWSAGWWSTRWRTFAEVVACPARRHSSATC
jgi:hypothetical protein